MTFGGERNFEQGNNSNLSTDCLFYDTARKSLGPAPAIKAKVSGSHAVDRCPLLFAVGVAMAIMGGFVSLWYHR